MIWLIFCKSGFPSGAASRPLQSHHQKRSLSGVYLLHLIEIICEGTRPLSRNRVALTRPEQCNGYCPMIKSMAVCW